jgi:hypothetical protein
MSNLEPKNLNNIKKIKWYDCKRDFKITLILVVLSFIFVIPSQIGYRDTWPITTAIAELALFFESMLICRKHFWAWLVVASVSITLALFAGLYLVHSEQYSISDIFLVLLNAMFFLILFLPMAIIIFLVRKKRPVSDI